MTFRSSSTLNISQGSQAPPLTVWDLEAFSGMVADYNQLNTFYRGLEKV